jgi:hypothetical protein
MLRLIVLFSSLLTISLIPLQTYASNNGTAACEALPEPFQQLATMTLTRTFHKHPERAFNSFHQAPILPGDESHY